MNLLNSPYLSYSGKPVQQAWLNGKLVWTGGSLWTGLGSDNNWITADNWTLSIAPTANASLLFAGTTRLTAFNNFAIDTPFNSISFDSTAGMFQLSGNRLTIGIGGFANNSINLQTINNDIKLRNGNNIINAIGGNITFNAILSGTGSIVKIGNRTANVSMARTISTGSVTISAGTLQFDNLATNGGFDLANVTPTVYNLNGSGATLNIFSNAGRAVFDSRTVNYSSVGNQTLSLTGNILANASTFITNGGSKNFITGSPIFGSNYLNGQFTSLTYNVADGADDVDLEVSAYLHNHLPIKTGNGKMSVTVYTLGIAGPLTISAGTFDIGTGCSIPAGFSNGVNTIVNNGTFSYSSNVNSNCSSFVISGSGNLVKNGTSTLTLSSDRCTYTGSTSILNGSIITTKNIATSTFTNTTLSVNFSTPPNINDAFRFFPGSTVQSYPSISLIGAPGRYGSFDSSTSTLSITS